MPPERQGIEQKQFQRKKSNEESLAFYGEPRQSEQRKQRNYGIYE